jgi:hypothetical protein
MSIGFSGPFQPDGFFPALDTMARLAYRLAAMKPTTLSLGVVVLLIAGAAPVVEHVGPSVATGKVIVLENENLIEGDVEHVGDQYRIRRSIGETWLEGERVLHLCNTRQEAYQFVRSRANLRDADERLRLARWCRMNNLRAEAIAELRAAAELRPDHAETRRMLAALEQATAAGPPQPAAAITTPPTAAPVDVTDDCMSMFAMKVQPILMNVCASCHSQVHPGPFRLLRCDEPGLTNRKTVQHNLAVVIAQINPAHPPASPLLSKAISAHGSNTQAPLHGRQMAAYRTLEDWVRRTLENNPHLAGQGVTQASPPPMPPVSPPPALAKGDSAWGTLTRATPNHQASPADRPPAAGGSRPVAAPAADQPAAPADPFDPEEFNRLAHPEHQTSPGPMGR